MEITQVMYALADVLTMDLFITGKPSHPVTGEKILNLSIQGVPLPTKIMVVGSKHSTTGAEAALLVKVQGSLYFLVHHDSKAEVTTLLILNGAKLKFQSLANFNPPTHNINILRGHYHAGVVAVHSKGLPSGTTTWVLEC